MPQEHDAITDPEIHEPKGVAAAVADKFYISDGAGSGSWRYIPHSACYYDDIGTGTTLTAPTAYTLIGPATTGDAHSHDFSHNSLGRLTYTGTEDTDITVLAAITFKHSAGAGVDCFFQVHVDGVAEPGGQSVTTADSANYVNLTLAAHTEALSTNSYIEIFAKCASGNVIVHAINLQVIGRI